MLKNCFKKALQTTKLTINYPLLTSCKCYKFFKRFFSYVNCITFPFLFRLCYIEVIFIKTFL